MADFKCSGCASDRHELGDVNAKATSGNVFTPKGSSFWRRSFNLGAKIKALVCRRCGLIHMYADLDEVDEMAGDGETRCRKCHYILKGITEPRCPECGEPI